MSSVPSVLTFDQFYREAFPQSLGFLARTFGLHIQDAEEIVQSAFAAFWQEHPTLADIDKPFAFFQAYLRMRALQVVSIPMSLPVTLGESAPSSLRDRRKLSLDYPVAEQEQVFGDLIPTTGPNVETVVMARLLWQEVCAAVNTLPLPQRVMIAMRAQGYPIDQIAARLQQRFRWCTPCNVRQALVLARQQVRQQTHLTRVQARLKHAKSNTSWARSYAACRRCGTTLIAHRAYGYCHGCFDQVRRQLRREGVEQRKKQYEWSRAYPACVSCGTTSILHKARGYCRFCYRRLDGLSPSVGA